MAAISAETDKELDRLTRSLLQLPLLEDEFSSPWSAEARVVLPSANPQLTATAVWGPALAWCALQTLGGAIHPENGCVGALSAFDRLRLRDALARSFAQLDLPGEDSWRAAARLRVGFLSHGADRGEEQVAGFPGPLWEDPDARWLLQVHQAADQAEDGAGRERENRGEAAGQGGATPVEYFNKELHEQLLWWIHLPELVEISSELEAGSSTAPVKPAPARLAYEELTAASSRTPAGGAPLRRILDLEAAIGEALSIARQAEYRTVKPKR